MCSQWWIFKLACSNYKGVRSFCALVVAYIKDLVSIQYPSLAATAGASSKRANTKTSSYCRMVAATWEKNRNQTALCASVCAVANCRQHRAAENRLRHTVLHENPSFPWADPSLFCINANYIILSGMQIRLDEAMADHLYRSVLCARERARTAHLCARLAVSRSY